MNLNIINVVSLETKYKDFINASSKFITDKYDLFRNGYIYKCEDQRFKRMSQKLIERYNQIQTAYNNISIWWDKYLKSVKGVENTISQKGSSSITEGDILSFAIKNFERVASLESDLAGLLSPSLIMDVNALINGFQNANLNGAISSTTGFLGAFAANGLTGGSTELNISANPASGNLSKANYQNADDILIGQFNFNGTNGTMGGNFTSGLNLANSSNTSGENSVEENLSGVLSDKSNNKNKMNLNDSMNNTTAMNAAAGAAMAATFGTPSWMNLGSKSLSNKDDSEENKDSKKNSKNSNSSTSTNTYISNTVGSDGQVNTNSDLLESFNQNFTDLESFYNELGKYAEQFSKCCNSTIKELQAENKDLEKQYFNINSYLFISQYSKNSLFPSMWRELSYDDSTILTPKQAENIIIRNIQNEVENSNATFDLNKEIEAKKFIAEEYTPAFETYFQKQMGMTYQEYLDKIESNKTDILLLKSSKYSLNQTAKEYPYLALAETDDYKDYQNNFSIDDKMNILKWNPVRELMKNELDNPDIVIATLPGTSQFSIRKYQMLTDENKMMYNYLFDKQGKKAAESYITAIEDSLNKSAGLKEAEIFIASITEPNGKINQDALNILKTSGKGFGDGIDNFTDGISNIFEKEGIISTNQYAQMYILATLENKKVLKGTYNVSVGVGNIAPTIAASIIVSAIATPAATASTYTFQPTATSGIALFSRPDIGMGVVIANNSAPYAGLLVNADLAQKIGSTVGYSLSAGSMFGNTKNQALVNGEDLVSATVYATCTGVSEFALGKLIGNIGFLNENAKFALPGFLKQGVKGGSQTVINAGLQAALFDKEIDIENLYGDAGQAFLYGMILSGITTGGAKAFKICMGNEVKEFTLDDALNLYREVETSRNTNEIVLFFQNKNNNTSTQSKTNIDPIIINTKINTDQVTEPLIVNTNINTDQVTVPTTAISNNVLKYGFNENGNYKLDESLFNPDVLLFAKPVNKAGSIPIEIGKDLENIFFNENDVTGIHRAGDASLNKAGEILEDGIELTGDDSSGVFNERINLDKNITLFEDKNLVNFAIFLHQIQATAAYKTSTGSGDAVIVSIPKSEINNTDAIIDINQGDNPILKPEYIIGAINSTEGNLSNFRTGINFHGNTENNTVSPVNMNIDNNNLSSSGVQNIKTRVISEVDSVAKSAVGLSGTINKSIDSLVNEYDNLLNSNSELQRIMEQADGEVTIQIPIDSVDDYLNVRSLDMQIREASNNVTINQIESNANSKVSAGFNGIMKQLTSIFNNPNKTKYGYNKDGNYIFNEKLIPSNQRWFATQLNENGTIPFEIGRNLENIFFNKNNTVGFQATGEASHNDANKILKEGVRLSGDSNQGAISKKIKLDKNINFFEKKTAISFTKFLQQIQGAFEYKTHGDSGEAVIVSIPKADTNNTNAITTSDGSYLYLKPEYVVAAVTSTEGVLNNFRTGINFQNIVENTTVSSGNSKIDTIKSRVVDTLKSTSGSVKLFGATNLSLESLVNQHNKLVDSDIRLRSLLQRAESGVAIEIPADLTDTFLKIKSLDMQIKEAQQINSTNNNSINSQGNIDNSTVSVNIKSIGTKISESFTLLTSKISDNFTSLISKITDLTGKNKTRKIDYSKITDINALTEKFNSICNSDPRLDAVMNLVLAGKTTSIPTELTSAYVELTNIYSRIQELNQININELAARQAQLNMEKVEDLIAEYYDLVLNDLYIQQTLNKLNEGKKVSIPEEKATGIKKLMEIQNEILRLSPNEEFTTPNLIPEEVIAISDIHGDLGRWGFVQQKFELNPNAFFVIEGDAMDRGSRGVEILLQIKEWSDQGRATYIPGNHDIFAYNYLKSIERGDTTSQIYKDAKFLLERNGGKSTIASFTNFDQTVQSALEQGMIKNRISLKGLTDWLGNQAVQRVAKNTNGINYAMAHAIFDATLYKTNPNFNLSDAYKMELTGNKGELYNRFQNIMWYRADDANTHHAPLSLPSDAIIIAGHTSQTNINMHKVANESKVEGIFIDTGKALGLQGYNLSKGKSVDFLQVFNEYTEKVRQIEIINQSVSTKINNSKARSLLNNNSTINNSNNINNSKKSKSVVKSMGVSENIETLLHEYNTLLNSSEQLKQFIDKAHSGANFEIPKEIVNDFLYLRALEKQINDANQNLNNQINSVNENLSEIKIQENIENDTISSLNNQSISSKPSEKFKSLISKTENKIESIDYSKITDVNLLMEEFNSLCNSDPRLKTIMNLFITEKTTSVPTELMSAYTELTNMFYRIQELNQKLAEIKTNVKLDSIRINNNQSIKMNQTLNEFLILFSDGNSNLKSIEFVYNAYVNAYNNGKMESTKFLEALNNLKKNNSSKSLGLDLENESFNQGNFVYFGDKSINDLEYNTVYHEITHAILDEVINNKMINDYEKKINKVRKNLSNDSLFKAVQNQFMNINEKALDLADIQFNDILAKKGLNIDEYTRLLEKEYEQPNALNLLKQRLRENGYGEARIDAMLNDNSDLTSNWMANTQIDVEKLSLQEKIFFSTFDNFLCLSDIFDAIFVGGLDSNGYSIFKIAEHGKKYYSQGTFYQLHEIIANYAELKFQKTFDADIVGITKLLGNDFIDFIENIYQDCLSLQNNTINPISTKSNQSNQKQSAKSFPNAETKQSFYEQFPPGRYGVNQNIVSFIFESGNARINDIIEIVQKQFPTMPIDEVMKFISNIDNDIKDGIKGPGGICDYASLSNSIIQYFINKESLFEEKFGYPLFRINPSGYKLVNDDLILTDLFAFINKDNLVTYEDGIAKYDNKYKVRMGPFDLDFNQVNEWFQSKGIEAEAIVEPIFNNYSVIPWQYALDIPIEERNSY